ncbi:MAG TPA: FliG C-terminal domain-containing protein [Planctomycetota bacterium]|nr:FliG C-terminal domain-containing protein [Planctomycetota bacterium]
MSTDRTIATLLLSIDQELAAKVLRNFTDDTVDKVTRAMQELQEIAIDREAVRRAYTGAVQRLRQGGMALGDVGGLMRGVLTRAFGEEHSGAVAKRANGDILAKRPFAMFEALTAEDLANLLTEEHPQIAAVFIAHLERKKGGEVLRHLDENVRADLVHRVATLDRTPADVVQRVLEVMRKKVKDLGLTTLRSEPKAWIKAAASILNNLGGGEKLVLEKIEMADATIAAAIRDELFTFDDIQYLDKKSMQKILAAVDSRQLAVSLKAVLPPVEHSILGNLSKRAADMVKEERDNLGPTPLSEVLAAQSEILKVIRDMMDKGDIKAGGAGEQMV